jgi:glucose-1-phosphate thymidylyltransferase
MDALVLAAGFGTRMGALSQKTAKPLLPVARKPVVEHLADNLFRTGSIRRLVLITNRFYYPQFEAWASEYRVGEVALIDDGVLTNENRLGAIADLRLALEKMRFEGPLLVLAGDNLYGFDFADFIAFQEKRGTDVVAAYRQPDVDRLRKTGVARLDTCCRVTDFEEKPIHPASEWAVPCLYIFLPDTLNRIEAYLREGNPPDAPGHLIAWLHSGVSLHAYCFDAPLYSIGDAESYARTRKALEGG